MEFDWDEGNRDKNLKHGVHDWEIEEAIEDKDGIVVNRSTVLDEVRFIYLGRAQISGRYL